MDETLIPKSAPLASKLWRSRSKARRRARVAVKAVTPDEPVAPRPKLNAALGVVLGFLLSVLWVLVRAWWHAPAQP